MDQVTASVEMIYEGPLCLLTTRYLSECGCEWVVDMWGNVRRVRICPRDRDDIRYLDQLAFHFDDTGQHLSLETADPNVLKTMDWTAQEIMDREG